MNLSLKPLLVSLIGALSLCGARAAVLTFEVSGTYDTFGQTIFGENGNAIPYFYRFTGDTNVMTLLHHIPTATEVDGRQTIGDWYGYGSAGITVEQATFGTVDWTAGGTMEDLSPGTGYTAKLWMDAPVSTTNQTRVWMQLYRSDVEGTLDIGQQGVSDFFTFFLDESWITDPDYHQARSTNMTVTVIPEPSTSALLLLGALGLIIFTTRRWSSGSPLPLLVCAGHASPRARATEWRGYSATRRSSICSSGSPLPLFACARHSSPRATEWRGYSATRRSSTCSSGSPLPLFGLGTVVSAGTRRMKKK